MIAGAYRFARQDVVVYGRPAAEAVQDLAQRFNASRLMILTTRSLDVANGPARSLAQALGPLAVGLFSAIAPHSPRQDVIAAAAAARAAKADLLVAFGGGSVIDAAKLVQFCLWAGIAETSELDPWRLGRGPDRKDPAVVKSGLRMIAIPTTLSAAEFTAVAGVTDERRKTKEAFTHPDLAPRAVVLDAAATLATPPRLWFSTGLKAVDHAVEQLCNLERAPMGDALAAEGLTLLARALPLVHARPDNLEARALCQHGMWLAISGAASGRGMGASHAIGHTLGGSYGVPHGVTSCLMLPAVLAWSAAYAPERQAIVAQLMGAAGRPAGEAVRDLVLSLNLPSRLGEVGITPEAFDAIAEHALHDRSIRTNPRPIESKADIVEILKLAA